VFKINRKTDYSVRVMLTLAKRPYGTRLSTKFIEEQTLIPPPFLRRIVADLSRSGLIHTFPGPNGGLQLARAPHEINLLRIWEAVEGRLLISDCIEFPEECPLDCNCPVRSYWGRLQAVLVKEMESTSLAELTGEANALITRSSVELKSEAFLNS
jgi:Rrf2 family protein